VCVYVWFTRAFVWSKFNGTFNTYRTFMVTDYCEEKLYFSKGKI